MSIEHFIMFAGGFLSAWSCFQIEAEALRRVTRRGSNPPSPGTKPPPPSGPPQPLTAQLIRYWTRRDDQIQQALTEGRTQRGNGNGGPTTPKPQPPPGRVLGPDGSTIGYLPINYPDPSPDRRPTNPFNGERIPNPHPRKP